MYRSHQNLLPVTNKYLAQKQFAKDDEHYKNSVRSFDVFYRENHYHFHVIAEKYPWLIR